MSKNEKIFLVLIESKNGVPFSFVWLAESRNKMQKTLDVSRFSSDFFVIKEIQESPRFRDDPENSREKEFFEKVGMENMNCGDCSECCGESFNVKLIDWEFEQSFNVDYENYLLKDKSTGKCVYCRDGCGVYDRRPAVCRVFKCTVAYLIGQKLSDSILDMAVKKLNDAGYFDHCRDSIRGKCHE
ncbi:YkgJ family cysteine cluster protein [Patescibacteria group bacterium]